MANPIGSVAPIRQVFTDAGVPLDPASITLIITGPDGVQQTVNTIAAGQLVKDSVGSYHYALSCVLAGTYAYVWVTTAPVLVTYGGIEVVNPVLVVPRAITSYELDLCIGAKKADELFDDDADGQRDSAFVAQMLRRAEDYALSKMLMAWSEDAAVLVMQNDSILRMHIAWVAAEFASERRSAFLAADGKGQYWAQFERAAKYFDDISKAELASVAESKAGKNAQSGGAVMPVRPTPNGRFVFAPDKNSPFGHGGF